MSCDANQLSAGAAQLQGIPRGLIDAIVVSLLCQIRDNQGGTSVSALPNNQIFVGNAANVATAVAMSGDATIVNTGVITLANSATTRTHLGLGTANAVQFAQMGIGTAPAGTTALLVNATALAPGVTTGAFSVIHPGLAGNDVNCFQVDATAGDPYFTVGQVAVDNGALIQYKRSLNRIVLAIQGHGATQVTIDQLANVTAAGTIQGGTVASTGIFFAGGNPGISQTFDIGGGNTQITFVGGIATAIA